jgi:hypothetical protein
METVRRGKRYPVAGSVQEVSRTGKGEIRFMVCGTVFTLPENSTYAKMIKSASRAIVVYEIIDFEKFPRIIEVIPNYTGQQVLQANSLYPAWYLQ